MTAQDTATARAIDKIRKLLKHANDNAHGAEAERETAMRMAMKLMAKHNLSMAQMEVEDKEDRDETKIEEFPDPFRKVIANAIANMLFCKFYSIKIPGKQKLYFHFVGLESNSTTAAELCSYVLKSVYSESQRAQKANGNVHGFGTSFRNGAAERIRERCAALRAEAEAAPVESFNDAEDDTPAIDLAKSKSTALTLTSLFESEAEANDAYIRDILKITLTPKTVTMSNKSNKAKAMGREFGDKVNLNRQIGADDKKPALK